MKKTLIIISTLATLLLISQSPHVSKTPSMSRTPRTVHPRRVPPQQPSLPSSFHAPQPVKPPVIQEQRSLNRQSPRTQRIIRQRHPRQNQWFSDKFYRKHKKKPPGYRRNPWNRPSWNGVNYWLNYDGQYPVYYSGQGTTYQMPPEEQQAPPIEETVIPLGVFAAGKTPREASYTSMFVQLDLARDGTITGTYYNTATNEVHTISGSINKATQEAVWRVTDIANSPKMITGLYNLTQDAAIVEVHFPNGKIQSWTLVRLPKP